MPYTSHAYTLQSYVVHCTSRIPVKPPAPGWGGGGSNRASMAGTMLRAWNAVWTTHLLYLASQSEFIISSTKTTGHAVRPLRTRMQDERISRKLPSIIASKSKRSIPSPLMDHYSFLLLFFLFLHTSKSFILTTVIIGHVTAKIYCSFSPI